MGRIQFPHYTLSTEVYYSAHESLVHLSQSMAELGDSNLCLLDSPGLARGWWEVLAGSWELDSGPSPSPGSATLDYTSAEWPPRDRAHLPSKVDFDGWTGQGDCQVSV